MGYVLISEVFARTGRILNDEGYTRWTEVELLSCINEALLDMVKRRPELLPSVDTFSFAAGALQVIPSDRIAIVDVGNNLGSESAPKTGPVPRVMSKDTIDAAIPSWQFATPSQTVQLIIGTPKMPRYFFTYPPQPASNRGRMTIVFSKRPTVVETVSVVFELEDEYIPIAIEYLLWKTMAKDSDNQTTKALSEQHLQNYVSLISPSPQPQQ